LTLAGRYLDFWTLTERALDLAFARFSSVDKALKPKLLGAYLALDAFPDARAILRDLKARGDATAILSNGAHLPAEYEPAPDATLAGLNELITMAP
jgi:2-haloacid dehalogenase